MDNYKKIIVRGREVVVLLSQVRIYTRRSVPSERHEISVEDQIADCMRACAFLGLPVQESDVVREKKGLGGDHFWDRGGFPDLNPDGSPKEPRLGLTRIVRDIEKDLVKVLVVYEHARLWRSSAVCGELVDILYRKGVLLLDRNFEFAPVETPEGRQMLSFHAAAAQLHREMAIVNVNKAHDGKRTRGEAVFTGRCLGFRPIPGQGVEAIAEELNLVRRIYRMYVYGEEGKGPMGHAAIASKLTDQGCALFPRANNPSLIGLDNQRFVYPGMVRDVLRSPKYIGKQHKPKEKQLYDAREYLIDGKEPAVDPALWNAAQARRKANRTTPGRRHHSDPMSGVLRCGICGSAYTLSFPRPSNGGHPRWNHRSVGYVPCPKGTSSLRGPDLDRYVQEKLIPLLVIELAERQHSRDQTAMRHKILELRLRRREEEQSMSDAIKGVLTDPSRRKPKMIADLYEAMEDELCRIDGEIAILEAGLDDLDELVSRLKSVHDLEPHLLRETIRSVIRWAAVVPPSARQPTGRGAQSLKTVDQGKVLFLTAWGSYHTACIDFRLDPLMPSLKNRKLLTTVMREASHAERLCSVNDLPEPHRFVKNLRREMNNQRGLAFRTSEWATGYEEV